MLSELLPSPEMHNDWQSYARALTNALDSLLQQSTSGAEVTYVVSSTPITPAQLPALPTGYSPIWLNNTDANLYLGNPAFDPPTAPNIVFIDTGNIANAAINVNKLADGAVTSAKILNATIGSADIGNAAILTALIADAQIVTAKINDLAVNQAKIANAAVGSAQIANLAVGTAHVQAAAIGTAQIADAAIVNAKIGNSIQSASWNPTTKAGWLIDKLGNIQGQSLSLYDATGTLIFSSGGIGAGVVTAAALANAAVVFGSPTTSGFGALAAVSLLTSGNISTYISSAAIGTALIANAAIGTAQIADAAILSAKIADAQVITAKIADAAITSAKILSLVIDKVTAGTLDAVIDMGTGLIRFTIGGYRLTIGKGFGTANQFIMWFGPSMAESAMSEASAIFYLKTDGSAYFGGSLLAGTLTNSAQTSSIANNASIATGDFGSNGNPRVYTVSYSWLYSAQWDHDGSSRSATPVPSVTIVLEKFNGATWVQLGTAQTFNGSNNITQALPGDTGNLDSTNSGSWQYTDNSGGVGPINVRARITSRSDAVLTPSTITSSSTQQRLGITSVEQ